MKPSPEQRTAIADVLDPVLRTADVSSYRVPGLPEDSVWRVAAADLDHPLQTYVGVGPDGVARVLPDDQPAFFELVSALGGAQIADAQTALGYVLAFLEVTRGPSVIVRPISDVAEIPWRPGTPDEEARRAALLADPPVAAPSAEPSDTGYRVQLWLIVDQRIQLNTFEVTPTGTLTAQHHVAAADLPLPVAR